MTQASALDRPVDGACRVQARVRCLPCVVADDAEFWRLAHKPFRFRPICLCSPIQALRGELERLQAELARYAEAIGAGAAMPALLEAMRTRERRRAELTAQLASLGERQAS